MIFNYSLDKGHTNTMQSLVYKLNKNSNCILLLDSLLMLCLDYEWIDFFLGAVW